MPRKPRDAEPVASTPITQLARRAALTSPVGQPVRRADLAVPTPAPAPLRARRAAARPAVARAASATSRKLFLGDNLKTLRESVPPESVDLIYLDPPFNSDADYNQLFRDHSGNRDPAQIKAFTDTWTWSHADDELIQDMLTRNGELARFLSETVQRLGRNDLSAYIVAMAARIIEMHRALKETGSFYLHVDPVASHYIKLVLDIVFGAQHFRNEIIWKRTSAHSGAGRWGDIHDVILFYTKSSDFTWNKIYMPYSKEHIAATYTGDDSDGRGKYAKPDLTGAGLRDGDSGAPWRGIDPSDSGRHWAVNRDAVEQFGGSPAWSSQQKLDLLYANGRVHIPAKAGGMPRLKQFLSDMPGVPVQDVIIDISPLGANSQERLGYPTQKPLALLERIVSVSTNPGDVVMDPFCGCGTTVCAAEKLGRSWIGMDITHLALFLIKRRLKRDFDLDAGDFTEEGVPTTVDGAKYLMDLDPYEFQYWILGEIGAQAWGSKGGSKRGKKGADGGIDGMLYFRPSDATDVQSVCISVKGGQNLTAGMVRDLAGVVARDKAAVGVFVCLAKPTAGILKEAATAGSYTHAGKAYPRIQILTVGDILAGKRPEIPAGALNVSLETRKVETLATRAVSVGSDPLF